MFILFLDIDICKTVMFRSRGRKFKGKGTRQNVDMLKGVTKCSRVAKFRFGDRFVFSKIRGFSSVSIASITLEDRLCGTCPTLGQGMIN